MLSSPACSPSGQVEPQWHIITKKGYDPVVALLVGFACTSQFSPHTIAANVPVKWPKKMKKMGK